MVCRLTECADAAFYSVEGGTSGEGLASTPFRVVFFGGQS